MDSWLGQLIWWAVASEGRPSEVKLEDLRAWVKELHMDMPSMPSPKMAHTFRAASGQLSRTYTDDTGLEAELTTREVSATSEFIVRHVVKTTTDARNQTIGHEKVAELKFFRPTRTAAGRRPGSEVSRPALKPGLAGADAAQVLALVEDFRANYATRVEYLSMAALRRVIRDYVVLRCDGVLVRNAGGIYFVESRWTNHLFQLQKLVSRFGSETNMHIIPLVDDQTQRAMISDGLADAIVSDCRNVVEAVEVKGGPTYMQHWRATNTLARLERLQRHYADLLGTTWLHPTGGAMTGAPRAFKALQEASTALGAAKPRAGAAQGGMTSLTAAKAAAKANGFAPVL